MEAGTPLPLVRRFPLDVRNRMAAYVGSMCRWCCEGTAVLVKAENGPYDWVCIDCAAALLPDETPRFRMHAATYSSVTCDGPYAVESDALRIPRRNRSLEESHPLRMALNSTLEAQMWAIGEIRGL